MRLFGLNLRIRSDQRRCASEIKPVVLAETAVVAANLSDSPRSYFAAANGAGCAGDNGNRMVTVVPLPRLLSK